MKTLILGLLLSSNCPPIPGMNDDFNLKTYARSCQETISQGSLFSDCVDQMVKFGTDVNGLSSTKWIAVCRNITLKKANEEFSKATDLMVHSGLRPNGVNLLLWLSGAENSALSLEVSELNVCMDNFLASPIDHDGVNAFKWITACRVASHLKKSLIFNQCVNEASHTVDNLEEAQMGNLIEACMDKVARY